MRIIEIARARVKAIHHQIGDESKPVGDVCGGGNHIGAYGCRAAMKFLVGAKRDTGECADIGNLDKGRQQWKART